MIKEYLDKIEKDLDVRKNLIELRKVLKTEEGQKQWRQLRDRYISMLIELLHHADAKVRKNAALILGEMSEQDALHELFGAYLDETQLFVRSSYLTAMSHLDYRAYMKAFRERMEAIMTEGMIDDTRKHLSEELSLLRDMLMTMEAPKKHRFTGGSVPSEMILLTSPGFEELTYDMLPKGLQKSAKSMKGGIRIMTQKPGELFGIRTVRGFMYRFCRNPLDSVDYRSVAADIIEAGLIEYLEERHEGEAPFYFRIDLRTHMVLNEKSQYVKRLATEIEELSGHKLQNSASNYECELRITENKQGRYSVYLILHTVSDNRFGYRKNALATSMHPVRAAEIVALASEYLAENARVLDPFCGTATLLIERFKYKKTGSIYGVDLFGEAVLKARENAERAHVPAYFINKDFRDFTHDQGFTEIFTELPAQSDKMSSNVLYTLYKDFMMRIPVWMRRAGYVIVCTTEESLLRQIAQTTRYLKVEAVYHLSGKRESALVIMRYNG